MNTTLPAGDFFPQETPYPPTSYTSTFQPVEQKPTLFDQYAMLVLKELMVVSPGLTPERLAQKACEIARQMMANRTP